MNKEQYLLICLIEELGEVQKSVSKALRFGLDDEHEVKTNLENIRTELIDTVSVIEEFERSFDVCLYEADDDRHDEALELKITKTNKWMEYSKKRGCLDE